MRTLRCSICWFLFVALGMAIRVHAAPPKTPASDAPLETLEGKPAPLVSKASRSEAESDRLIAGALYAEGRLLLNRDDKAGTLRKFERAWRYDPTAQSLLREIVSLAIENRRVDEAIRYALLTTDLQGKDALLFRRLAIQLSERGKWQEALRMFEASAGKRPAEEMEITDLSSALLLLEIARLCFLTEQFPRSAEIFARVRVALEQPELHGLTAEGVKTLSSSPDQTWSLMAEAALAAKRFDEAADLCQKAHAAKPDEARLSFRLARIAAAQEQWTEALRLLEEAFEKKLVATSREPFDLLKRLLENTVSDAGAAKKQYVERLNQMREKDTGNQPLGYAIAQTLVERKDLQAAEALLKDLLEKQASDIGYRQLVDVQYQLKSWESLAATLAAVATKSGSLEAISEFINTIAKDETAVNELLAVGTRQREAKLTEPPSQARALGLLAVRAKKFEAAEANFEIALAEPKANKAQILAVWGTDLYYREEPARAAEVLQRMVDERTFPPNEIPVYYHLSAAYELAGQTGEALRALKQGIARNPNTPRLEGRLGWIQYHAKNYPAAATAYREFIERFDKSPEAEVRAQLRQARLVLSNVYLKLDQFADAVESLEQVLDEFPDDVSALNDLGYLWAEKGQHLHRALAMTHRAAAADPENRAYRDSLGWAYYQLERYEEAARELRFAAADESADGVVLDHLGDAEAHLGRRDVAIAAWQRALAAFEKEGEGDKAAAVKTKLSRP